MFFSSNGNLRPVHLHTTAILSAIDCKTGEFHRFAKMYRPPRVWLSFSVSAVSGNEGTYDIYVIQNYSTRHSITGI